MPIPRLPDCEYPVIDQRLALSELVMIETPVDLEALLRAQACDSGYVIPSDQAVELRCQSDEFPTATSLVFWPADDDRLYMLARPSFARGRV